MKIDGSDTAEETEPRIPSSIEFASEPRAFVKHLARRMAIDLDETTLRRLTERMSRGASREQITRSLRNIVGVSHPLDKATAALNFCRTGQPTEALVIENIVAFAPEDHRAFVLHAYSQVLGRHPGTVELARLTHQLEMKAATRLDLLGELNAKSTEEGHKVIWDSAQSPQSHLSLRDAATSQSLIEVAGFRTLSQVSSEILSLCRYADKKWELAPSMISRIEEVRADSWIITDGFVLTGPRCHLSSGNWVLDIDIVQPEWASVCVDIVANLGADQLFNLTACGNLSGSFCFEKLHTHAFLEVRLRAQDTLPGQWISIQRVRLRKMD